MERQDQGHDSGSERLTWDRKECARQIGVSVRTLDRMVAEGRVPVLKARDRKSVV